MWKMTPNGENLFDVHNNLAIGNRDILLVGDIFSTGKIINLKGESEFPSCSVLQGKRVEGSDLWW